ncbi:MAG TPA: hypothetical protein VG028_12750 [Terriglobia bacterium]|nr:hypothetical protein [Terriglobia bacterium]
MDKKALSDLEERLLEVNKVIEKLDPAIRVAGFEFLKPFVSSGKPSPPVDTYPLSAADVNPNDVEALIQKHGDGKPHENANLLAAIWYRDFGSHPFSLDHIRERATSTGLTIPAHVGMTFRQAKDNGKKLYESIGKGGLFKPTVVGEAFFKATYNVKKGTKTPPSHK